MARPHRDWDPACKVYIGNLSTQGTKNELEDTFSKYGPLRNVWVARNPPGFAFIEFEDARDAEDAVKGLDGTRCCGVKMAVEMSSGKSRKRSPAPYRRGGGRGYGGSRGYGRPRSPYYPRKRSRSPMRRRRSPTSRSASPSSPVRRRRSPSLSPPVRRRRSPSRSPRYSRSRSFDEK